jgi:hypothetical protein
MLPSLAAEAVAVYAQHVRCMLLLFCLPSVVLVDCMPAYVGLLMLPCMFPLMPAML